MDDNKVKSSRILILILTVALVAVATIAGFRLAAAQNNIYLPLLQIPSNGAFATFAFNPVPTIDETTFTTITLNGGAVTGPVLAGSTITVTLHYQVVQVPWCPGCAQQLIFGFADDPVPSHCINIGNHGSGNATIKLTAPDIGGARYIRFNRKLDFDCTGALVNWGSAPALPSRVIGVVAVLK